MSVIQKLAKSLKSGTPVFGTWSTLADPATTAMLMREDFETIVLDLQHGAMDYTAAATAISMIAATGKPTILRIPVDDFALASRLADAGAAAIIAPMVNTAEDARKLVAFTKYPPLGERSWGPNNAFGLSGLAGPDYFWAANDFVLAFAMVETKAAMDNIDEILAVPGLDGVFVGPADLSINLSGGTLLDAFSPAVNEALKLLQEKTGMAGKYMAAFAPTPEQAREHLAAGFNLVTHPGDAGFMIAGARQAIGIVRRE